MNSRKPPSRRAATTTTERPAKSDGPKPARRAPRTRPALAEAPPEKSFWVNFGPILRNLHELRDALADGISDEQFEHHVSGERNDFAAWVEDVLGNAKCAKALRKAHSRAEAVQAVEASLGTRR